MFSWLSSHSITKTYPDLDCVFINSGIQRGLDFSKPDEVDLESIQTEFTTNYLSYLALTKAFLPFLMAKKEESGIILYVDVQLQFVPLQKRHLADSDVVVQRRSWL